MTARPQRETPATCALLLAMMAAYAAVLLPVAPRRAGAAASPLPPIRRVAPTRAFIDSWVKAALLAQHATEGVVVEVDAEDTANTIEVDVVRQEGPGRHRRQPGRDRGANAQITNLLGQLDTVNDTDRRQAGHQRLPNDLPTR